MQVALHRLVAGAVRLRPEVLAVPAIAPVLIDHQILVLAAPRVEQDHVVRIAGILVEARENRVRGAVSDPLMPFAELRADLRSQRLDVGFLCGDSASGSGKGKRNGV